MQKSKYKIGEWENYRSIAKTFGLTIPALKKILVEEGLLAGHQLSKLALDQQVGLTEMISSRFGEDKRILWQVAAINRILGKRNIFPLIGKEEFLFAENFMQITSNIGYLGRELHRFLKFPTIPEDEINTYPFWIQNHFGKSFGINLVDEAISGLQEAIYENHKYLFVADQREFIDLLDNDFQAAFELAKLHQANQYEKMRMVIFTRLFQFLGEWATDKRIAQYHRQPVKLNTANK